MEIISLMELMEDSKHLSWESYFCLFALGNSVYKLWVGK